MLTLIKILTWLASPLGLLVGLCSIASLLLALNKAPRTRLTLTVFAIGQLIFFASPWAAVTLSQGLETEAKTLQTQNTGAPYAAILLLGGGIDPALPDNITPANAREAFDRVIYAAQLYHQGLAPKIIVSGSTGLRDTYPQAQTEATTMQEALILMGVPQNATLLEEQSLTTRQNMAFTARLLRTTEITGRLALVTSATHMPRAMANAQNVGLSVDAYPTDWVSPQAYRPFTHRWLPNAQALEESERSLKEWLALMTQY